MWAFLGGIRFSSIDSHAHPVSFPYVGGNLNVTGGAGKCAASLLMKAKPFDIPVAGYRKSNQNRGRTDGLGSHREKGDNIMTMGDKIKHAGEEAVGKVKEATGKATNDQDLEARGQGDQAKANVKQAGDSVADAAHDVLGK